MVIKPSLLIVNTEGTGYLFYLLPLLFSVTLTQHKGKRRRRRRRRGGGGGGEGGGRGGGGGGG